MFDATYDADAGAFIDILNEERTKEFLEQLYEDYRDGYWVNDGNLDNIPEDALAIITLGNGWDLHGFTPYALTENLFPMNIAETYGVSASSPNKALALRALVICYSDPEIASKLTYTTDLSAQEWKQRNEATRQYKSTEFTGFIPYLSEEQITKLYDSVADLNKLTSELYEDKNTQKV